MATAEGFLLPKIEDTARSAPNDTERSRRILQLYLSQILKPNAGDPSTFEFGITDGANDGGLDGWAVDEDPESPIILVQCKWVDVPGRKLSAADSLELYDYVQSKLIPDKRAGLNREVTGFMGKRAASYRNRKLSLVYLTNGTLDPTALRSYTTPGASFEFSSIDAIGLALAWYDSLARERPIESSGILALSDHHYFEAEFRDITSAAAVTPEIKVLQCMISATDLATAYGRWNRRLLIRNLRYGLTNKINTELKATAEGDRRKLFYLFHNGISIICNKMEILQIGKGYSPTTATVRSRYPQLSDAEVQDVIQAHTTSKSIEFVYMVGFQIVNGGQSTATLADVAPAYLKDIFLPCKISVTDSKSLASIIARFNNSQTRIGPEQLVANSEEQTFLQTYAALELDPPIFYQRKAKEKWGDIFRVSAAVPPKVRQVTFADTYQAFVAFCGNPGEAYGKKSSMINPDEPVYDEIAAFPRKDLILMAGLLANYEGSARTSGKATFDFDPYWTQWAIGVFGHLFRYKFNISEQDKLAAELISPTGNAKWAKIRKTLGKVVDEVIKGSFGKIDVHSYGYFFKNSEDAFDLSVVTSVKPSDLKDYVNPRIMGPDLASMKRAERQLSYSSTRYQLNAAVFMVLVDRLLSTNKGLEADVRAWV